MALRSYLTTYVNLCWVMGHLIAAGVLRGLVNNGTQWSWRIPFAIQWIWPPVLLVVLWFAPESPWWQVRMNRISDAEDTLTRLYTHAAESTFTADEHIKRTIALMDHTIQMEKDLNIGTTWVSKQQELRSNAVANSSLSRRSVSEVSIFVGLRLLAYRGAARYFQDSPYRTTSPTSSL